MTSCCPSQQALHRVANLLSPSTCNTQCCSKEATEEFSVILPLTVKDLHIHFNHREESKKRGYTREENITYKERRGKKKREGCGERFSRRKKPCSHTNNHRFFEGFCWGFSPMWSSRTQGQNHRNKQEGKPEFFLVFPSLSPSPRDRIFQ